MTITDLEAAGFVELLYDGNVGGFDHIDTGEGDDGVYWGLKRLGDFDLVVLRGSTTALDWERDFESVVVSTPELGAVHRGFFIGMRQLLGELRGMLEGRRFIILGHSLGAARGALLAGLATVAGIPPAGVLLFGEPRPGFERLAQIVAPLTWRSYRNADINGHDAVTDVPAHVPLVFPFVHPKPLIDVCCSPPDSDDWGPFRYHHFALYHYGLSRVDPMPAVE